VTSFGIHEGKAARKGRSAPRGEEVSMTGCFPEGVGILLSLAVTVLVIWACVAIIAIPRRLEELRKVLQGRSPWASDSTGLNAAPGPPGAGPPGSMPLAAPPGPADPAGVPGSRWWDGDSGPLPPEPEAGAVPGMIGWADVTVEDAEGLRDFYQAVVGWLPSYVPMDGYDDYTMSAPATEAPVAGICHARGADAALPPQWLLYIRVADLEKSLDRCVELGGKLLTPTRDMGEGRYCVIQDPAGAVAALFEPSAKPGLPA
jgi:predicted enzyme related to lactoylglutathione lyase